VKAGKSPLVLIGMRKLYGIQRLTKESKRQNIALGSLLAEFAGKLLW
jgi:hypothetical protein